MVYSVRSNKPIVIVGPVKMKHVRNDHEKRVEQMMKTHTLTVKTGEKGEPIILFAAKK